MKKFLRQAVPTATLILGMAVGAVATTNLGTVAPYFGNVVAKTAAYTVSCPTDSGTEFAVNVSSTVAITLPNNGQVGCTIGVSQIGTAKVTLVAQTGGRLNSSHSFTGTFGQGAFIGAHVTSNAGSAAQWEFTGDGS